jgi:hypothetical protein
MPTIRLTGILAGRTATIGTADIGDADTDSLVVNAEFDSDLVPDDAETYNLGSDAKPWNSVFARSVACIDGLPCFIPLGFNSNINSGGGTRELKTTNGAENGQGWRVPLPGSLTHLTAQLLVATLSQSGSEVRYEVYKNGSATGLTLTLTPSATGALGGTLVIDPPLDLAEGDRVTTFVTPVSTGATNLEVGEQAILLRVLN